MLDLGTMHILEDNPEKIEYIVIKIGNKTFSTTFAEIKTGKDIKISRKQLVETQGIGKQNNLWIKGNFTEEEGHKKLQEQIPFQLNVYSEINGQVKE